MICYCFFIFLFFTRFTIYFFLFKIQIRRAHGNCYVPAVKLVMLRIYTNNVTMNRIRLICFLLFFVCLLDSIRDWETLGCMEKLKQSKILAKNFTFWRGRRWYWKDTTKPNPCSTTQCKRFLQWMRHHA